MQKYSFIYTPATEPAAWLRSLWILGSKAWENVYLAVFAPKVFREMAELLSPLLIGKSLEDIEKLKNDLIIATGYWSLRGAARHVISAFEIAMIDGLAKTREIPVYELLGGRNYPVQIYGSGGDSLDTGSMEAELKYLRDLNISLFKIRARKDDMEKAVWTINKAKECRINIAIDMTQNLSNPGQSVKDVLNFENSIFRQTGKLPVFLEEALGIDHLNDYPELKMRGVSKIAGGEIVTTEAELIEKIKKGYYHIVQPDATVIGGVSSVMKIFEAASEHNVETVVHCWGGAVGMMANYHTAIAGKGSLVEWPMPHFPLRDEMVIEPWAIDSGYLQLPQSPGLGVRLTTAIEERYPFREDAVYRCLVSDHTTSWHK